MKFKNYHFYDEIKKSIENVGFQRPTDIQYKSIPPILKNEDVLAIAQTGTGKTAAFVIPVLNILQGQLKKKKTRGIKCLVMVPTRELALQIAKVFEQLSEFTRLKTFCLFGGVEQDPQINNLQNSIDILVTTPGRMFDLLSQRHLGLKSVKILILDEADHMLDLGFIKDIQDVVRHIPKKRQTLFFSATINKEIKELAYSIVKNPIRIQISPKNPVAKNIDHSVAFIKMDDKRFFLENMLNDHPEKKILIFVRTKIRAERVCKAMERVNIKTLTIHSGKEQKERFNILSRFKSGKTKFLITTDVSARGIDIPNVDYVINYDLPNKPENYVHRVGRTGRGANRGIAYSFCCEEERDTLQKIENFLGKTINVMIINNKDYSAAVELSTDNKKDLQTLLDEIENFKPKGKKRKKKKIKAAK